MKKWIWLTVLVALIPGTVSADELWVRNEGGLEVVIEYEGDTATVTADSGIYVINPDYGDGTAKAAAADIQAGWVVIEADNITGYTIEVACNQQGEDVVPEAYIVKDAPAIPDSDDGGGQTIAQMNAASFTVDWTGQEIWRWS
jgi:hypothetical protein